jgi:hypothetical protein
MPADSGDIEDGLSRRQVLARGAVAAGVIWAAPVIRTATAYATSSSGTERPCTTFYVVCIDPLGIRPVRFPVNGPAYDDIAPEVAAAASSTTSTTTSTSTTTTSTSTTTTTTTTAPPPLPPGGAANVDPAAAGAAAAPLTTPTTAAPVDDLGLFPQTTAPAAPVAPALPPDPHQLSIAAAQGAKDAGAPDNLPPGIKQWLEDNPDIPVRYPDVLPMLTQTSDDAWAVLLQRVEGPDPLTHQCRPVKGWAQARGHYAEFFLDPNPAVPDETGRRMIFPNPLVDDLDTDPTALIENIIFVFCCPQ